MDASLRGISPLRQRMRMRKLSEKTQTHYLRWVRRFSAFVGRAPDTATVEALHSFNSACARSDWGIVRSSIFAVLRLMTRSNLVGCSIGRSEGFAPLRILSM